MNNWIGAVECASHSSQEWVAILSDDAIPLNNWRYEMSLAVQHCPTPVLGLTYFGDLPRQYAQRPYIVGNGLLFGGGIAYRVEILDGLLQFAKAFQAAGNTEDDICTSLYMAKTDQLTACVTHAIFGQPSLTDTPSLIGNTRQWRKPTRTIGITEGRPSWDLGAFRYDFISDEDIRQALIDRLHQELGGEV